MTQVFDKPAERPRLRETRDDRESGTLGVAPAELTRLFAQLWTDGGDGDGSGANASLSATERSGRAAMIETLIEQLAPRMQAVSQWPLQATLYLPRLGRINARVRREQGAWSIDLEAQEDATARWLSGVRKPCEDQLAAALGQPVSLHLPTVGCA